MMKTLKIDSLEQAMLERLLEQALLNSEIMLRGIEPMLAKQMLEKLKAKK